ncbi:hypothetical protein LINGRAHAP2_LOCUS18230 [Linum grandiflorum]
MGEIDTKPMESVKVAVSLFHERETATLKETRSSARLSKELSRYKIQLEAKDSERLELLRKLDCYHDTVDHLTSMLQQLKSTHEVELLSIRAELLALKDENRKAIGRADSERGRAEEMEKELESAKCEVGEVRGRADAAEMELRKLREKKQRRKAALAALREESLSFKKFRMSYNISKSADHPCQPLGKLLNLSY